jgi:DtxR family Mn-dependent transcriptional regulator
MSCTKPSVNKALKNLKENGYIEYETYGPIKLTKEGENLAKKILEAYDIVYLFLKDVLGLEKEIAKCEADKIKLVVEDNTLNSLAKYVHKVLDLKDLDCCYDLNKEECRSCKKRKPKVKYVLK